MKILYRTKRKIIPTVKQIFRPKHNEQVVCMYIRRHAMFIFMYID